MRKQVYERALSDGKTTEQAALIASVFRNSFFLGCGYHDDVMATSQTYWETEWIQDYIKLAAS